MITVTDKRKKKLDKVIDERVDDFIEFYAKELIYPEHNLEFVFYEHHIELKVNDVRKTFHYDVFLDRDWVESVRTKISFLVFL